jgi:hypothetical protein
LPSIGISTTRTNFCLTIDSWIVVQKAGKQGVKPTVVEITDFKLVDFEIFKPGSKQDRFRHCP